MGREFLKQAKQIYGFVEDPFLAHYINALGKRLVSAFPEQPFRFHFYIIKNDNYNAFAAPAGHVFIHSGLISAMDNEEELAGILAHEIAHVSCRHISEKIENAKKISLATLAGVAAAVFLGSPAIAIGTTAAGQAASLAYSRKDERQADQLGAKYLCRAGYSSAGLLSMLEKINAQNWFSVYDAPTYLSTHPGTEERIAYLDTLLASDRYDACRGKRDLNNINFKIFKTKITAVYQDPENALKTFEVALGQDREKPCAHYGLALILSKKARHKEAIKHLKTAREAGISHPELFKALGREYLYTGNHKKSLEILENMPECDWYDEEKQLLLAKAALGTEKPDKSLAILEKLLARRPDKNEAHYVMGKVYGKKGRQQKVHYHLGIYYKNLKKPQTALFHLQRALSMSDDPATKKKIKSLIAETKQARHRPASPRPEENPKHPLLPDLMETVPRV